MDDLISREAAMDALTDNNIEMNFDSAYDGDIHQTKRAAIRIIANMPTIDAISVEWLRSQLKNNPNDIESAYDDICINDLIDRWQNEQGAR